MNADIPPKRRFRLGELARAMDKHISTIVRWTHRGVRGSVLLDRTALRRREREVIATLLPRVRRIQEKTLGRLQQLEAG